MRRTFKVLKGARYDFLIAYSPHETRAKNVPIQIESGAQAIAPTFDQTQPLPAGETFRNAGFIQRSGDAETKIMISNTGTEGFVILHALQLLAMPNGLPLHPQFDGEAVVAGFTSDLLSIAL